MPDTRSPTRRTDAQGLRELYAGSPDLVILDVAMPGLDGWATLERIREVSDVPVLMLTARDAELERVRGLKGGADDYVVKPFGRQELVARVDVLLRRPRSGGAQETYADARLSISFAQRAVRYDDREVALTRLEYRLLSAFVAHPNQVLSHDQLRELVWGDTHRHLPRRGEALRRLPAAKARPGRAGEYPDRDRPRLRLPLQNASFSSGFPGYHPLPAALIPVSYPGGRSRRCHKRRDPDIHGKDKQTCTACGSVLLVTRVSP